MTGLPRRVRNVTGTPVSASMTREGVLYLAVNPTSTTDVYIGAWDAQSGRLTGPLMPAAGRYAGFNSGPEWSPSGDRFIVQIGEPGNPDGIDLLVRSLPSGEERIIRPQMAMFSRPRFGLDGRGVVVQGRGRNRAPLSTVSTWRAASPLRSFLAWRRRTRLGRVTVRGSSMSATEIASWCWISEPEPRPRSIRRRAAIDTSTLPRPATAIEWQWWTARSCRSSTWRAARRRRSWS